MWKCKSCGKCCLTIPCVFAQVKYGISKGDDKVCPALIKDGKKYKCRLIEEDAEVQGILLDGQCDDPDLAHLKKKMDATTIVREFFPSASDDEVDFILWNHTGFPEFWDIPKDGWTATQCLRKQLSNLATQRYSQKVKELV